MFFVFVLSSVKILWAVCIVLFSFNIITPPEILSPRIWIIISVVLVVFFDFIDGRIAKRFNKNTAQRRLFDNVSDILVTHISYLSILYFLDWTLWWYIPLFLRDAFLFSLGLFVIKKARVVVFPGVVHKIGRLLLPIAAIFMICDYFGELALLIALLFFYITLFDYFGIFAIQKNMDMPEHEEVLNEVHLNSNLVGLRSILSQSQKLLSSHKE